MAKMLERIMSTDYSIAVIPAALPNLLGFTSIGALASSACRMSGQAIPVATRACTSASCKRVGEVKQELLPSVVPEDPGVGDGDDHGPPMLPVTDERAGEKRSNFEPRHSHEEQDSVGSNLLRFDRAHRDPDRNESSRLRRLRQTSLRRERRTPARR